MKTIPIPPRSQAIVIADRAQRWTPHYEAKLICWLAQQFKGNIAEIGCNTGITTRDLALTNPDKTIFAIDYIESDDTMVPGQKYEKPDSAGFCAEARGLPNVRTLNVKSGEIIYHEGGSPAPSKGVSNVRFVFIDGDHSYHGVKIDTEKALAHIMKTGGCILWHDYLADRADWAEVTTYLDKEIAPVHDLIHVAKTNVAYCIFESPPQKALRHARQIAKRALRKIAAK